MQKIIEAPNVEAAKLEEQEADVRKQLVDIIASKLAVLEKLVDIDGEVEKAIVDSGVALMKDGLRRFRSEEWRSQQQEASNKVQAAAANKYGGVALVPKVIE